MSTIQVGDKVRVKHEATSGFCGEEGVVTDIHHDFSHPVDVELENGEVPFDFNELEVIKSVETPEAEVTLEDAFSDNETDAFDFAEKFDAPYVGEDRKTLYIAGPMNGKENLNRPKFYDMEEKIKELGYDVINPARMDDEREELDTWHDYLRRDFEVIIDRADGIVLFDDWHNSRGATNEMYFGNCIGIPIYEWDEENEELIEGPDMPAPFQAKEIVLGARRYTYGHPKENLSRIAALWSATLGVEVSLQDVALMMIQVKIAREQNAHDADNIVDIIGYAYTLANSIREQEFRGGEAEDLAPTSDRHKEHLNNHVNGAESVAKNG